MTYLLVTRHGETDWNRQHRFQGQIDVPLNDIGHEQARRLAARLAGETIDVLLASDLSRARSTAQPLAEALGHPVQPQPLWREQSFGVLEGLDVPTIRSEHAGLWSRWIRHEADYALPGGESTLAFFDRVMTALRTLHNDHGGARVLLVTHGGVLDMLWRAAHAQPLSGPRTAAIPNTGINRLRFDGERLHVDAWADAAHLDGLPPQPSTAQTRWQQPEPAEA